MYATLIHVFSVIVLGVMDIPQKPRDITYGIAKEVQCVQVRDTLSMLYKSNLSEDKCS